MNTDKVFYNPGDVVKVRHITSPNMYVVERVTRSFIDKQTNEKTIIFVGIKCRWFDFNNKLQEEIFSTKDLIHS